MVTSMLLVYEGFNGELVGYKWMLLNGKRVRTVYYMSSRKKVAQQSVSSNNSLKMLMEDIETIKMFHGTICFESRLKQYWKSY